MNGPIIFFITPQRQHNNTQDTVKLKIQHSTRKAKLTKYTGMKHNHERPTRYAANLTIA